MLLQELNKLHERIEDEIGPPYHREDEISWIIQITDGGEFEQIIETSGADGHMTAFRSDRPRTVNVAPYLVIDKPYYVLGLNLGHFDDEQKEQKVKERHQAYVELIYECHEETDNPYVGAVETFLNEHVLEARNAPQVEEMDSGDMVTFRVNDKFVHELEAVKNFWIEREEKRNSEDSDLQAECLICEEEKPIAKVHPISSQLGQAGLISANEDAFESYGLNRSEIAPLCQRCAQSYGWALRYLFHSDEHHIWIAGTTFAYWTEGGSGMDIMNLLTEPDPQEVQNLLESPFTGREEARGLEDNFYAVTATTNQSRIIIKDWLKTTVEEARANLAQFFERQRMVDKSSGQLGRVASVYSLAGSLVRDFNDLSPNVVPALLDNALKGTPLPDWLLNEAVNRARSDTDDRMTHPRVALIKMVLNQKIDKEEGITMSEKLDSQNDSPAYLCGRLLGVLENIQRVAQGDVNTTIVDRYYGTASSSPVSVFGNLMRKSQNHLSKIRKNKKGAHSALQKRLEEILSKLDGFPKTLSYKEQGQFSLGYYHQKAESRAQAIEHSKKKDKSAENK